jgi:hypothetical protein
MAQQTQTLADLTEQYSLSMKAGLETLVYNSGSTTEKQCIHIVDPRVASWTFVITKT